MAREREHQGYNRRGTVWSPREIVTVVAHWSSVGVNLPEEAINQRNLPTLWRPASARPRFVRLLWNRERSHRTLDPLR